MLQVGRSGRGVAGKKTGLRKDLQIKRGKQTRSNKQVESVISMGPGTYLGKEGILCDINS